MNSLQRVDRIRDLLPAADPLPWSKDSRGRITAADGHVIFDPVSFDDREGVRPQNDVNVEIVNHLAALAHEDFLFVVPEMVQASGEIGAMQQEVHDHANKLFPQRNPSRAWLKLYEELGEVIKDPRNPLEWADVFYLLFDLSKQNGIDIRQALKDKMPMLEQRIWSETPTGTYQHKPNETAVITHNPDKTRMVGFVDPLADARMVGFVDPLADARMVGFVDPLADARMAGGHK